MRDLYSKVFVKTCNGIIQISIGPFSLVIQPISKILMIVKAHDPKFPVFTFADVDIWKSTWIFETIAGIFLIH